MEYIRTATLEFPTGPACRLQVETRSGALAVEGREVERTTVQVVAHLWEESATDADDTMERIIRGVRHENGTVRIEVPHLARSGPWFLFGRGSRVDLQIVTPLRTRARLASRSGRVEVAHVEGPVEVEQRSGRTSLLDVGGNARVSTRSGACEVERVAGDVVLASRTGKVTARTVSGSATVECRTGLVQVEDVGGGLDVRCTTGRIVAERVHGDVHVVSTTGAVVLVDIRGSTQVQTTTGAVRFRGAVLGNLDVQVTTGAIQLEVDPEHPFLVDAHTVTGAISSDLQPRRGAAPPAAGGPHARLRATTGSIRISRLSRL